MAATVSLSKGVFAFKRVKRKSEKEDPFTISHFWRQEEGFNDPQVQDLTYDSYHICWSAVEKTVETFLDETHAKVFEDLINYIRRVGFLKLDYLDNVCKSDIPTACLVTGVNMPDHANLFDSLTKSVKERITPYVVRLCTADCMKTKLAMNKIIFSLMNEGEGEMMFESDSESDEIFINTKSPKKKKPQIKKSQCSMSAFASWYKETEKNEAMSTDGKNFSPSKSPSKRMKKSQDVEHMRSPKKRAKAAHLEISESETFSSSVCGDRPVVIIIEEVESVPVYVLQDIILISSEYRKSIPFVFIFGVSTTPAYIHRHLSQEASYHVAMETFQAQPSSVLLSQLIERVLMSKSLPFHVGGKVFKLLLDIFLFHDLSIKNFISGLKFCMLEHFLRGEASFLCCPQKKRKQRIRNLKPHAISTLRNLESYKRLEENFSVQLKELTKDDSYFCEQLNTHLEDLETYYSTFCCLVKVLHCLVCSLPGSHLGRQVREVFSTCLSQHVTETEEFQNAWKYLSLSAKEELAPKVIEAIRILSELDEKEQSMVASFLEKLQVFSERLHNIDKEQPRHDAGTKSTPPVIDLKPGDRFYLREKLLGAQKAKAPKNPYEELRTDILAAFEHVFIVQLKPMFSRPFHEVFFFDSIANVKYQLLGSVRATVTTGLANPQKYLQCNCCVLDNSENIVTTLPDLSLCYKLHLECGRLINLYDWMQAFVAVVQGEEESSAANHRPKNNKKAVDGKLQARFTQSVSELQLLGFIKPTKRKTDHVQRLTWGGC